MTLYDVLKRKLVAKVYAINPILLEQQNIAGWTNLGLWDQNPTDYTHAATRLAESMATSLNLTVKDSVLDVGCGYGASLNFWENEYGVADIHVLELQQQCCEKIVSKYGQKYTVFQQSIFDAKPVHHVKTYDAIISVDATYHYAIDNYLNALKDWISESGRIGFHYLIKSATYHQAAPEDIAGLEKKLDWVKVKSENLLYEVELKHCLNQFGYQHIQMKDLTQQVLGGFAMYILENKTHTLHQKLSLDFLKIYMTAQLCAYVANSGLIRYVEVVAFKKPITE